MRGDVKDLFDKLLKHLNLKKILLNSLLDNEKSASDLIKKRNDAEDEILKIVENETAIIDEISVEDYNCSQIKDEIIRRYSFDFSRIFRNGYRATESEISIFKDEILQHEKIISEIIELKKNNVFYMDKYHRELGTQISELERMRSIKIVMPKDLRSF